MTKVSLPYLSGLTNGRWMISGLNFALVLILAITAAFWSWQLWELGNPQTVVALKSEYQRSSSSVANTQTHWFGGAGSEVSRSQQNLKLIGTFAGAASQPSYAMLAINGGKVLTLPSGAEVMKGQRLQAVFSDHVLIANDGQVGRLDLDRKPLPEGLLLAK